MPVTASAFEHDLSGIPESGLLDLVRLIVSKPGNLSARDRAELEAINQEFVRREPGIRNARRQGEYKLARLQEAMREAVRQGRKRQAVTRKLKERYGK